MHGLGNDFILYDGREKMPGNLSDVSMKICNRNTGVGADGFIVAVRSDKADIGMRYFNSDGSEGEMCGNGIGCFSRFIFEEGIVQKRAFTVETLAGIIKPVVFTDDSGQVTGVVVDMGKPVLSTHEIPVEYPEERFIDVPVMIQHRKYRLSSIRMGVPHTIVYVEGIEHPDVERIGRLIENHPLFPHRTNVNFVQVEGRRNIKVNTWERGAGSTLACGTGCCAAAVISALTDKTDRTVEVELALGRLSVEWHDDDHVYMKGPAENICSGVWYI